MYISFALNVRSFQRHKDEEMVMQMYFLGLWTDCKWKAWKLLGLSCWVILSFPLKDLSVQQNECSLETYGVVFILKVMFSLKKNKQSTSISTFIFRSKSPLFKLRWESESRPSLFFCLRKSGIFGPDKSPILL